MKNIVLLAAIFGFLQITTILAEPKPLLDGLLSGAGGGGLLSSVLGPVLGSGGAGGLVAGLPLVGGLLAGGGPAGGGLPAGGNPSANAIAGGPLSYANSLNTGDETSVSGVGNSVNTLADIDLK